ncbi:DNA helicase/exodeoxyribonuclease V, subunit A [Psychrobacillus sp. OK028]|uniref:helicase-exonuclease AddAB subunit AddA n=1 Tax=Psychrobacillus sp. OK028 TaxID=1884359 RepID=UPI000890F12E|nr:helicase-exonuclease AddAB subunit AddA [Psychrobacillus sp. OK028]SDM44761.1 DNA helicase/exodeoxyribonuclease V, subunit A [Psychrobacillus sp. OK028]
MNIPNMPAELTWTPAQWKAIWATGSDVLVSAAAGSGKTAVLIDRLIQKVISKETPINVDELLVVTFTNASAAEMRHRMGEALEKAIANDPTSNHLRKQLSLLNKAQISTLHSFCLNIVRQYAYMLTIDPGFRIANETEAAIMRDDMLAEVLEEAYHVDNPEAMYRLSDSFTSDRDDQSIEIMIEKLYSYSRVHPEPAKWLLAIPEAYNLPEGMTIDELSFIGPLKLAIIHHLEEAIAITEEIRRLANDPNGPAPLAETAMIDQQMIQEAVDLMKNSSWQSVFHYFQGIKWGRAAAIKKDSCDEGLKNQAVNKRTKVKKIVNDLKDNYFTRSPERLLEEMRLMAPQLQKLVELTIAYGERYTAAKNEKGLVDFSDLEHYALDILSEHDENGKLIPSDIAKEYKARFKEVLVDEYQDTNLLQETILQFVKSGDENTGNMFMVGDVKQSIYRFRLAEPMLFLGKYLAFNDLPIDSGIKIDLNANFRSRKEVLHATNYIFSQIMGEQVGEIEYDEAASLKPGAPYEETETPVELALLYEVEDGSAEPTEEEETIEAIAEEELKKSQAEARYIISKINEMINSGATVYDPWKKAHRPVRYSDMVILMRSMTWSGEVTEQFKEAGIPLYAELSKGYFEAIEVLIMLHTLRTIDNPYQDISLASVLRSPFVGLSESELALIRLSAPKEPFYDALKTFVANGGAGLTSDTAEKLQRFLLQYEDWRDLSRRGSLADLIWQIYLDTHYYEIVGAMPNGKQRQANLRILHDRAIDYEKTSFRGLFRFLRFIDRMRKRGDDLGAARAIGEKENVVRLMTIHSSKGLEFPVVFLAGIGRPFNQMDFNESYLFDQSFGLAVKAIDPEKRISYTSLPFLSMKEKKQMELKAEEMRVLYVAMTRAKEHLFLIGSIKDLTKTLEKWSDAQNVLSDEMLPGYMRAKAKGYLDWIGSALARHTNFRQLSNVNEANLVDSESKWRIITKCVDDLKRIVQEEEKEVAALDQLIDPAKGTYLKEVKSRFDTPYLHEISTHKRSKQTVSEMKKIQQLMERSDDDYFQMSGPTSLKKIAKRPFFLQQETTLTGAEAGTAVHAFMQNVDLQEEKNEEQVLLFAERLAEREILTKAEQAAIVPSKIVPFFRSDIAERLRNAKEVMREFPFTYALEDGDGDKQIIQGVVDCLFLESDGSWVLLDYKTDKVKHLVKDESLLQQEMQKRYQIQLSLYSKAIEAILQVHIKEKVLYLFDVNRTVSF